MKTVPRGKANAVYNRDKARVSAEVYGLYRFLHQHPTMAPNRRKDVLRASVNYTPFGYIFGGLISSEAAKSIDSRLTSGKLEDPCAGLHRDHFHTWKETAEFFFSRALLGAADFWAELERRNEVVLLTKSEHARVGAFQRKGHGHASYQLADVELLRVDTRAINLLGNKAGLVREHWPPPKARQSAALLGAEHSLSRAK